MTARLTTCLLAALCLSACAHAQPTADAPSPHASAARAPHALLWRDARYTVQTAGLSREVAALHRRLVRAYLARGIPRAALSLARDAMSRAPHGDMPRAQPLAAPRVEPPLPHAQQLAQLLDTPPTSERQRRLLLLAERAAPHDIATARRALAAAQDKDAPADYLAHHTRVYVAAHLARAREPYHNILRGTWAAYPAETPIGAELRTMFAAHAASALDRGAMRAAHKLASPALHRVSRATVLAYLIVAHERRGEAASADLLALELRHLSPQLSGEALERAARVLLDAGVAWRVPDLLSAPLNSYQQSILVIIDLSHERHSSPKLAHAMRRLIERQPTRQRQLEWISLLAPGLLKHPSITSDLIYQNISREDTKQHIAIFYNISAAVHAHAGLDAALGWADRIDDAAVRAKVRASCYAAELRAASPSEALLSAATYEAAAHPNDTLRTALVTAYAERGRCDEALALFTGDVPAYVMQALALLIVPCARAGKLDAAHQLALRLPTPVRRAEALVWLVEVAPLIAATRGAP